MAGVDLLSARAVALSGLRVRSFRQRNVTVQEECVASLIFGSHQPRTRQHLPRTLEPLDANAH